MMTHIFSHRLSTEFIQAHMPIYLTGLRLSIFIFLQTVFLYQNASEKGFTEIRFQDSERFRHLPPQDERKHPFVKVRGRSRGSIEHGTEDIFEMHSLFLQNMLSSDQWDGLAVKPYPIERESWA